MDLDALVSHIQKTVKPELRHALARRLAPEPEPLAIVGMACRLPGGCRTPELFWDFVRRGGDAVTEIPEERWEVESHFDPAPGTPDKMYTRYGAFLEDVDRFDPYFFGIAPLDAPHIDPQQRLLLEVAWEALEDAGLPRAQLAGSRTGVFFGFFTNDYFDLQHAGTPSAHPSAALGTQPSMAAGRLSHWLDLRGPSLVVNTACSSSLVALHLACQSLRAFESSAAIVGGVQLYLTPREHIMTSQLRMVAADGRCRPLDAAASGFVQGEGCGVVVLKRLSDALRASDRVIAIVRGTAVNQDGRTLGITAPNPAAQADVIRDALVSASVTASSVSYVEMHGTGTPIGDPCEFEALAATYGRARGAGSVCALGSAKTNIGHTSAAAGIAGVIRAALCLSHAEFPPHPHFRTLNSRVQLAGTPFVVPTRPEAWRETTRRAAVSAFGASGTNAHAILESAPPEAPEPSRPAAPVLVVASAASAAALSALSGSYAEAILRHGDEALERVSHTTLLRRTPQVHRVAVVGRSAVEIASRLDACARGDEVPRTRSGVAPRTAPRVAFVFPGQGSQWLAMGAELFRRHEPFRDAIQSCDAALRGYADWSLVDRMERGFEESDLRRIDIQLALFSMEIALARLLEAFGVRASAVVGHSMGEVAAAHVSGVLSLEDAVSVMGERTRLIERLRGRGAMAVLELSCDDAAEALVRYGERVSIASRNAPRSTVIAGESLAVTELLARLEARGVFCRRVLVDYASHCSQMEPILPELRAGLSFVRAASARVPFYSTLLDRRLDGREMTGDYWANNLRQPVLFEGAVRAMIKDGVRAFVECSPHPILLHSVREVLDSMDLEGVTVPAMRRDESDDEAFLEALGALHLANVPLSLDGLFGRAHPPARLPGYPFQRERFWHAKRRDPAPGTEGPRRTLRERRTGAGESERVFTAELTDSAWAFLRGHAVAGAPVLPGALFVDLGLSVVRRLLGEGTLALEGIRFHELSVLDATPALVARGRRLDDEATSVTLLAEEGAAPIASIARASRWSGAASSGSAAERDTDESLDVSGLYEAFRDSAGIEYEGAFRALTAIRRTDGGLVATIDAGAAPGQVLSHELHPAVLDAALQAVAALLSPPIGLYGPEQLLPVSIDRLRLFASPGLRATAFVRIRPDSTAEAPAADLVITGQSGAPAVEIEGFRVRRSPRAEVPTLRRIEWQVRDAAAAAAPRASWVVVADDLREGESVAVALRRRGHDATAIGAPFAGAHAGSFREALYVLAPRETPRGGAAAAEAVHRLCTRLRELASRVASSPGDAPARFWLVTRGAVATAPYDAVDAVGAAAWGFLPGVMAEHPSVWWNAVDAAPSGLDAESVADELVRDGQGARVALRERRFEAVYAVARAEDTAGSLAPSRARADRAYLVAGGTSGVGLALAERLVRLGAGHVVLASRSGVTPEASAFASRALSERASRVTSVAVDVTKQADVEALVRRFGTEWPVLGGVVHAAGVIDDRALADLDDDSIERVLGPKVAGTANLVAALAPSALDFFVCCSSASAFVPSIGQSHYGAANAFMDALVQSRVAEGAPGLSIQWGPWGETGLVARDAAVRARLTALGVATFSGRRGGDLFARALATLRGVVAAVDFDPVRWCEAHGLETPPLFRDRERTAGSPGETSIALVGELGALPPRLRLSRLAAFVGEQLAAVLRMAPERLDANTELAALGLTSLSALDLRRRLERGLGIPVQAAMAWRHPTIGALAETLCARLFPEAEPAPAPAPTTEGHVQGLSNLSRAEVARLLDAELAVAT